MELNNEKEFPRSMTKYATEIEELKAQMSRLHYEHSAMITNASLQREKKELSRDQATFNSRFFSDFTVNRVLDEGEFGHVFEVESLFDFSKYAIKRIPIQSNDYATEKVLRELREISRLDHPGIIRYNSTWAERPPKHWQEWSDEQTLFHPSKIDKQIVNYPDDCSFIYIQMEMCPSSLKKWLEANQTESSRSLPTMIKWFTEIISAVAYIHDRKIIHQDLRPSNIMFTKEGSMKISDLGTREITAIDGGEFSKRRSSDLYMSPEQLSSSDCSTKTDIFALGLILAELCVVMTSTEKKHVFDNYRRGLKNIVLNDVPLVETMVTCLTNVNEANRPECKQILERWSISGQLTVNSARGAPWNTTSVPIIMRDEQQRTFDESFAKPMSNLEDGSVQKLSEHQKMKQKRKECTALEAAAQADAVANDLKAANLKEADAPRPQAEKTAPVRQKIGKCWNFPKCPLKQSCHCIHPKFPCTKFPNCPLGWNCLFLHEFCPNDEHCVEPDCAYEHIYSTPTYYRAVREQEQEIPRPVAAVAPIMRNLYDQNAEKETKQNSRTPRSPENCEHNNPSDDCEEYSLCDDESSDFEDYQQKQGSVSRATSLRNTSTDNADQKKSVNFDVSDDESELEKLVGVLRTPVSSNRERCHLRLQCTKARCEYTHPSEKCKAFPKCPNGGACMFLHEVCKNDGVCINEDCDFEHYFPHNINKRWCNLGSRCEINGCTYLHPKECVGPCPRPGNCWMRHLGDATAATAAAKGGLRQLLSNLLRRPEATPKQPARETAPLSGMKQPLTFSVKKNKAIETWEVDLTDIEVDEEHPLEDGFFGKVFKARMYGRIVAVKSVKQGRKGVHEFMKEAEIGRHLSHRNIVKTLGICSLKPYIIMEFLSGGNLKDYLNNHHLLYIHENLPIALKIASAMEYLGSRGFVHRDLAARNILVGDTPETIKLTEFGMTRRLADDSDSYETDNKLFPYKWTPPEGFVFGGNNECEAKKGKFSTASDVWSFAVVLWELYSKGAEPYRDLDLRQIYDKLKDDNYRLVCPTFCPPVIYEKMLECWSLVPTERPTFVELHAFLLDSYAAAAVSP